MKVRDGLTCTRKLFFPRPDEVYVERGYPICEGNNGCYRPLEYEDKALGIVMFRWCISLSLLALLAVGVNEVGMSLSDSLKNYPTINSENVDGRDYNISSAKVK